jgi:hypothetical protein
MSDPYCKYLQELISARTASTHRKEALGIAIVYFGVSRLVCQTLLNQTSVATWGLPGVVRCDRSVAAGPRSQTAENPDTQDADDETIETLLTV